MSEQTIYNQAPIEKQINIEEVKELHIHADDANYVKDFHEVESAIEQLPNELHELLKAYGALIKTHITIEDILNISKDELVFPNSNDTKAKKLKSIWEGWYLFLIYLALMKNDGTTPTIGDYIIQINRSNITIKHVFYTGEKNFEGLVHDFLTTENARSSIKYDVYIFNNKNVSNDTVK